MSPTTSSVAQIYQLGLSIIHNSDIYNPLKYKKDGFKFPSFLYYEKQCILSFSILYYYKSKTSYLNFIKPSFTKISNDSFNSSKSVISKDTVIFSFIFFKVFSIFIIFIFPLYIAIWLSLSP